jgi:holliday junction DNA helicase RuvA
MIASLTGMLKVKNPTELLVEVQGVGYSVHVSLATFGELGAVGSTVSLFTYLHVREDALQLYGFSGEEERNLFRLLIGVTGIGPRMAQGILSGISTLDLRQHILEGNAGALTTIPGVGRKTAERLIVELRERLGKLPAGPATSSDEPSRFRSETLLALLSLGYPRPIAEQALASALRENGGAPTTIETLLKAALRHTAKQ